MVQEGSSRGTGRTLSHPLPRPVPSRRIIVGVAPVEICPRERPVRAVICWICREVRIVEGVVCVWCKVRPSE